MKILIPKIKKEEINIFPRDLFVSMLYWKLYSSYKNSYEFKKFFYEKMYESNLNKFTDYVKLLPKDISRNVEDIVELIDKFNDYQILGLKSREAVPMRTTILHFIFPNIITLFDKQVLRAVSINEENANHKIEYYEKYQQFAWELEDKYKDKILDAGFDESPLRVIDMALWVNRGKND